MRLPYSGPGYPKYVLGSVSKVEILLGCRSQLWARVLLCYVVVEVARVTFLLPVVIVSFQLFSCVGCVA